MAPNTRSKSKPVDLDKTPEKTAPKKSTPKKNTTRAPNKASHRDKASISKFILADFIGCLVWASVSSIFLELALYLQGQLQTVVPFSIDELHLVLALIVIGLGILGPLITLLTGAAPMLNPAVTWAVMIIDRGSQDVLLNLLRILAQGAGHGAGVFAAVRLVPVERQSGFILLSGKVKAGLCWNTGFAAEAVLVFLIAIFTLYMIEHAANKRKSNLITLLGGPLLTIFVCAIGALFTGPSLNPFLAFFWNFFVPSHTWRENLLVFWGGPFAGATLAAFLWSFVPKKQKFKRGKKE